MKNESEINRNLVFSQRNRVDRLGHLGEWLEGIFLI
jgi:hypothetical protein